MLWVSDKNILDIKPISKTYNIWWVDLTFEAGSMALLINGSVVITDDKWNTLLTTAGIKESWVSPDVPFFPLVVDFQEKYYASGKIGWSRFNKREWRPSDDATLTSRLIDRPIRPMFKKWFVNDTQIIVTQFASDGVTNAWYLWITWASMALMMAGAPFEWPIAGVKIVDDWDGGYIFNPTVEQEQWSKMNLLVAGTTDAITMVESQASEVSQEEMMKWLRYAFDLIKELCKAQEDFMNLFRGNYRVWEIEWVYQVLDESSYSDIEAFLTSDKLDSLYGLWKLDFTSRLESLWVETREYLIENNLLDEDIIASESFGFIDDIIYKIVKWYMRTNVLERDRRLDYRALDEVRWVRSKTGVLPFVHGSGLFQRWLTQVLSVTTLGWPDDVQLVDGMLEEHEKRYMHHYNFPPYSVWEVRMLRWVGRREIWHWNLAQKALEPVLPSLEDFPYTIRVVSETLTCNGSSSMWSISGSTLSLMHAGVPIKSPIAWVAMGMIYDEKTHNYKILTDIQAQEDFLGDMDFKVAMSPNGITAMQLDVKISGLSLDVFDETFTQARSGIDYILSKMLEAQPTVSKELSPNAPLIMTINIPVDKIREVIGRWWENVQWLEEKYSASIHIEDDGKTIITAKTQEWWLSIINNIKEIIWMPEVWYIWHGDIVKIIDGVWAIVEFRGKSGMIHISKLSKERVAKVEDIVNMWDKVEFEIIQVDLDKWRIWLKRIEKEDMPNWDEKLIVMKKNEMD